MTKRPSRNPLSGPGSAVCLALLVSTVGCAGHARRGPASAVAAGAVRPLAVTDQTFAREAAVLLLSSEPSAERTNRLAGVVRFQLDRAGALYREGHDEAGLAAVEAALYLMRAGEFDPVMVEGRTTALLAAANAVARQGSEGRALALYSMLSATMPAGAQRDEVRAHLAAIQQWTQSTRNPGPMQTAGNRQRTATERALWEPRRDSLVAARTAIIEWMERALAFNKEQSPPSDDFERDEAIEAYQALRAGPMVLTALFLRNGDPAGALSAMETPSVSRLVSPHLHEALRKTAEEDDAAAWMELFSTFERTSAAGAGTGLDPELSQAAAWGAAVELCRVEPKTLRGVMPVATLIARHGMGEVGPLLLAPVVQASGRAEVASWALGYVLETLSYGGRVGDFAASRRTFANARPMLEFIAKQSFAKDVSPSVGRVHLAMGALEARAGELRAARPLVEQAVSEGQTLPALALLSAIDRQQGNVAEALRSLDALSKLATQASDPTTVADAHVSEFEVLRDAGKSDLARSVIEQALRRALDARQLARTGAEHAGAERVLARILEHYGELDAANRATERAYSAGKSDLPQVTATLLDAARRGLVRGQIRTARSAARHAIEANVAGDDLVYIAIWLRLLERKLMVPSDGTVEEALARVDETDRWPERLRAWCTGRLSDDQLLESARTRVERTEASFYGAMAAYAAGSKDALARLSPIAKSETIELVEVTIARDILAAQTPFALKLPPQVEIP